MADRPTFEIGLTMAGAVSAGAYTAGVIDFLFEALDAIEDVRAGRPTAYLTEKRSDGTEWPDAKPVIDPPHDVKIRAMSGTSAGSMVTAIVATILGTRVPPVTAERGATQSGATGNPLYDAWVEAIHYDKLLSTGDLTEGKHVLSILNAEPLEAIVNDTLRHASKGDYLRPYVGDPIPVFFCIGNLRGVRYSLDLNTGGDVPAEYQMSMHADWVGFEWSKQQQSAQPGAIPLSPKAAFSDWKKLGDTALASGAFPIGLSARTLVRDFVDYEKRKWFNIYTKEAEEFPPLDKGADFPNGYAFVNADGGIFNNEPLELCRVALSGSEKEHNPREAEKAKRAVILIDPFPNLFELEKEYKTDSHRELLDVAQTLFGAMISQARFKMDELALAKAPNVASRYAIMPSRHESGAQQRHAIACGSLGGFGGFLSKAFRHHDFMLGRRNCQKFLADHFVLPAGDTLETANPLFAQWQDSDMRKAFTVDGGRNPNYRFAGVPHLPIVPLLGKLASPDYTRTPPWPVAPHDLRRADLKQKIIARGDALKSSLIAQYQPGTALQAGISSYWWLKKKDWVERFAIEKVGKALDERGIRFS